MKKTAFYLFVFALLWWLYREGARGYDYYYSHLPIKRIVK